MDGGGRIARGTGHQARETEVLDALEADWAQRRYGPEEQPWLAWLLRFALSEVDDPQGQGRFRMMPGALDAAGGQDYRWTHVALDEAQDLSVAEASLLTSFVHPDGAVTVSADFRQAVTPTKGMEDAAALSVGSPLRDTRPRQPSASAATCAKAARSAGSCKASMRLRSERSRHSTSTRN